MYLLIYYYLSCHFRVSSVVPSADAPFSCVGCGRETLRAVLNSSCEITAQSTAPPLTRVRFELTRSAAARERGGARATGVWGDGRDHCEQAPTHGRPTARRDTSQCEPAPPSTRTSPLGFVVLSSFFSSPVRSASLRSLSSSLSSSLVVSRPPIPPPLTHTAPRRSGECRSSSQPNTHRRQRTTHQREPQRRRRRLASHTTRKRRRSTPA